MLSFCSSPTSNNQESKQNKMFLLFLGTQGPLVIPLIDPPVRPPARPILDPSTSSLTILDPQDHLYCYTNDQRTHQLSLLILQNTLDLPIDLQAFRLTPWDPESESKINLQTSLGQFCLVYVARCFPAKCFYSSIVVVCPGKQEEGHPTAVLIQSLCSSGNAAITNWQKSTICLRRGICEKGSDNFCSILGLFVVWVIYDVNLGPRRSGFYPQEES